MKMKKITLALAGVLAAAAFAPEAGAVPAFARQTGMACTACHFQHFPVLNSFGRSFKSSGYTLMGTESQVEGENLSLPSQLNSAIFINAQYQKTNGTINAAAPATGKTTNDGLIQMPQALSMFIGGRISEHVGFQSELAMISPAGIAAFKMPFMFDVGSTKVGVVPFTTDTLGVAHSFELMNTGAVAVHEFNQADLAALSAQAYVNTTGVAPVGTTAVGGTPAGAGTSPSAASGFAFVASGDMGFINFAKYTPSHAQLGANGNPTSNYLRAAWLGDVGGWDTGVGFQSWSGRSVVPWMAPGGAGVNATPAGGTLGGWVDTKATAIDAQMLGEVSGMPLTLVASYATAPGSGATAAGASVCNGVVGGAGTTPGVGCNLYNMGTQTRKSFNIGAELGWIPHKSTVQVAYRNAKSGQPIPIVAGGATLGNASDNALMLGVTYELAMNVKFALTYSMYSGDLYNGAASAPANAVFATPYMGNRSTWFQLESAF